MSKTWSSGHNPRMASVTGSSVAWAEHGDRPRGPPLSSCVTLDRGFPTIVVTAVFLSQAEQLQRDLIDAVPVHPVSPFQGDTEAAIGGHVLRHGLMAHGEPQGLNS